MITKSLRRMDLRFIHFTLKRVLENERKIIVSGGKSNVYSHALESLDKLEEELKKPRIYRRKKK